MSTISEALNKFKKVPKLEAQSNGSQCPKCESEYLLQDEGSYCQQCIEYQYQDEKITNNDAFELLHEYLRDTKQYGKFYKWIAIRLEDK